ncbi:MAG: 3'(2'),5'-bisphosphate nucleotidase CysQ [Thermoplasmata archaeon]|nr:3'(2'),5'-bisphosphate nucleotidase CysQ [Thermoplasmata archaeon]
MTHASARDHADAAEIAAQAGQLLLRVRRSGLAVSELRAAGDERSHEFIMSELRRRHPDDAVLSEEDLDDPVRLSRRRVWIIDPLDGTREFSEPGREDWAVHVALAIDGLPVAAAVSLPASELTLSTVAPKPAASISTRRLRLAVSRTRPTPYAQAIARSLDAELVPMGSAGAKTAAVVTGTADAYAHSGGQYEWDSAAPVAVAAAAGLHVSRLDGSPLVYNQPDPFLPDLLICRRELADRVLAVVAAAARDQTP